MLFHLKVAVFLISYLYMEYMMGMIILKNYQRSRRYVK